MFFALSYKLEKLGHFFRDIKIIFDITFPQNEVMGLRSDDLNRNYCTYTVFFV